MRSHRGGEALRALKKICCRWGYPRYLRSDNGREFRNADMSDWAKQHGIQFIFGSPGHPQSQAVVERFNRTLLQLLRKSSTADWSLHLDECMSAYWHRVSKATGFTPLQALTGTDVNVGTPGRRDTDLAAVFDEIDVLSSQITAKKLETSQHAVTRSFAPGQRVLLRAPLRSNKLTPRWERGWSVKKVFGPRTALISHDKKASKIANFDLLSPVELTTACGDVEVDDTAPVAFAPAPPASVDAPEVPPAAPAAPLVNVPRQSGSMTLRPFSALKVPTRFKNV